MGIFKPRPKVKDRYRMKGDPNHVYEVTAVDDNGVDMVSNVGIYGTYTLKDLTDYFEKIK